MGKIQTINAREILDSRGNPTVEVDLVVKGHIFSAAVPSGASTGSSEALELRDDTKRYSGKGVRKAIRNIEKKIAPRLKGMNCTNQEKIDRLMIDLDGTENKSKLGANAMLGVSLAVARAGAFCQKKHLFDYLGGLADRNIFLPRSFFNVINGGEHAGNKLAIQEFMIAPRFKSFRKNLQAASEIYHVLKKIIKKKIWAKCN